MASRFMRRSRIPPCTTWNGQSSLSRRIRTICSTASLVDEKTCRSTDRGIISLVNYVAFAPVPPITSDVWERFKQKDTIFAMDHGSLFCDEAVNRAAHLKEAMLDDVDSRLQMLSTPSWIIQPPCSIHQHHEMSMRYSYYHALKLEAMREKLYMEYLVKEFKHWEWLTEWLDERITGRILDFLSNECPHVSQISLLRGLKLHMSRIPYEYLCIPLPQGPKELLIEKINAGHKVVDYAILERTCPSPRLMSVKIKSIENLARNWPSAFLQARNLATTPSSLSKREKQQLQRILKMPFFTWNNS